jgi:hypothetical protein
MSNLRKSDNEDKAGYDEARQSPDSSDWTAHRTRSIAGAGLDVAALFRQSVGRLVC